MRTIGVDLGTTNTVAATNGDILPLDGCGDMNLLPSVVAFPPSGNRLVGKEARDRRPIDPKNTIYSAKRLMGEKPTSYMASEFKQQYPFELKEHDRDGDVAFVTRAGKFTAREIATMVMSAVAERAHVNAFEVEAVVTVPVAFRPNQRTATRRALRDAGFADVRMVDEPIATAIAYLQRSNLRYAGVYDLGGGTFDFAVLDCSTAPFKVIANGGDPFLGGDDIDRAIAGWAANKVLAENGWDLSSDSETFDRLVMAGESAKIVLSKDEQAIIDISSVDPAAPTSVASVRFDRENLWYLAAPHIRRTFGVCDEVLSKAGLHAKQLDAVFMAGGATAIPGVAEHVQEYFGRRPRTDVPPLHSVCMGASLAAARPDLGHLLGVEKTNA